MTTYAYYNIGDDLDETDQTMIRVLQRSGALVENPDVHHVDYCDHDSCHSDDGDECDHDYCHDDCIGEDYHSEAVDEARDEGYEGGKAAGKEETQEEADEEHYNRGHSEGYAKGLKEGYKEGNARSTKVLMDIAAGTWHLYEPKSDEVGTSYFQTGGGRLATNLPPGDYYLVPVDVKA
jgi:hypothetical protein